MPLNSETYNYQARLAEFCRTGGDTVPGVRDDRVGTYRRLVLNVMNGTLEKAFPITRAVISTAEWSVLSREFLSEHSAASPQLWRFPREFYQFVLEQNYAVKFDRPYLNDLMLFEWTEIEVFMMADVTLPIFQSRGDVLDDQVLVNPEHQLLALQYPVFRLPAAELRGHKGEYFLLIYRHPTTLTVSFSELSPFYAVVIESLRARPTTGRDALNVAARVFSVERNMELNIAFYDRGRLVLESLLSDRGLLGFFSTEEGYG